MSRHNRNNRLPDHEMMRGGSGDEVFGYTGAAPYGQDNRTRTNQPGQGRRGYPSSDFGPQHGSVHGTRAEQHHRPIHNQHDDPRDKYLHNNVRNGMPPAHPGYDHGMRPQLPRHDREDWNVQPPKHRNPENYSWNPQGNLRPIGQDPRQDYFDSLEFEDYGTRGAGASGYGGYDLPGRYETRGEFGPRYGSSAPYHHNFGFDQGSPGYDSYSQNHMGGNRTQSYHDGNSRGYGGPRQAGSGNPGRYPNSNPRRQTNGAGRAY